MIEFRSVTFSFEDTPVIRNLSMTIDDGEFVVLAGANGSGKTTIFNLCLGLHRPDDGCVLINGTPVEDDLVGARTDVGMVFQRPTDQFVASTVGADIAFGPENLGLDRAAIDRRVADALRTVGLSGRETERIDELSGGEQERVAIAGALAMEPSQLLLDEPFTGLDADAHRSVLTRLESLSEAGTGIVVATHDLRDVTALADRIVGLDEGQIVIDDAPSSAISDLPDVNVRVPKW